MKISTCYSCKFRFAHDEELVPKILIKKEPRPICIDCLEKINFVRKNQGLAVIVPKPGAYLSKEILGW